MNATKSAFRVAIDDVLADRGIDLEELHRRFIEGGYGGVDRYDRNISLWRFEQHVNGETGGLSQRFIWGLHHTLGRTDEESRDFFRAYYWEIFERGIASEA